MDIPAEYYIFKINILKKVFLIVVPIFFITILLGQKEFSLGFLVGGLLSMAIFSLLYKYVLEIKRLSASRRKRFIVPRTFLIYLIMGLALFIGIKKGMPAFLGTAAGLLSLKIVIFIQVFREKHHASA